LVVDDDPDVLFTTRQVLKAAGYRVTTAATGRDGLRIAKEAAPFLMLLDVRLPDMSGFEVCRLAKSDPALAGMLVILISGTMTDSESRTEGLEQGADAYLARPIDNRELLAQIQAMWRIWQVESALRESQEALRSDIAERKRTEEELADLGNRLNSVLDAATQVAIIATDPQGVITVFNSGAERMLGYREEEMVGKQTPQIFHLEVGSGGTGKGIEREVPAPHPGFRCVCRKRPVGRLRGTRVDLCAKRRSPFDRESFGDDGAQSRRSRHRVSGELPPISPSASGRKRSSATWRWWYRRRRTSS
jgi:CheY-like chemotaxis protein